jgi:hypothetical protein
MYFDITTLSKDVIGRFSPKGEYLFTLLFHLGLPQMSGNSKKGSRELAKSRTIVASEGVPIVAGTYLSERDGEILKPR